MILGYLLEINKKKTDSHFVLFLFCFASRSEGFFSGETVGKQKKS